MARRSSIVADAQIRTFSTFYCGQCLRSIFSLIEIVVWLLSYRFYIHFVYAANMRHWTFAPFAVMHLKFLCHLTTEPRHNSTVILSLFHLSNFYFGVGGTKNRTLKSDSMTFFLLIL